MEIVKFKTCAVTGRRPDGFSWEYRDPQKREAYLRLLYASIENLIQEGVTRFITGGALGVDMDAAEIILSLQQKYPFVTHLVALPYQKQGGRYASNDKNRHEKILQQSEIVVLSPDYTSWCMQERNEYMVNSADLVIAFVAGEKHGGTYNTIRYAKRKNKPVYLFDLDDCFSKSVEDWIRKAKSYAVEQLKLI